MHVWDLLRWLVHGVLPCAVTTARSLDASYAGCVSCGQLHVNSVRCVYAPKHCEPVIYPKALRDSLWLVKVHDGEAVTVTHEPHSCLRTFLCLIEGASQFYSAD